MSPAVTVIVPCRNEAKHIEACVTSILAQTPPPGGFELLVVDGMSDDGTRDILARMAKADPRIRVVDNPGKVKPKALNLGLKAANGEYVAVLDAHNRYAEDYLAKCLEVLLETNSESVGGAVFAEAEDFLARAISASHHSKFAVGNSKWHDTDYEGETDSAWGGFFRKSTLERVGAWDEELVRNQDDELSLRITRAGGRIWQSPRIKTWYTPRGSLKNLWNQYRQYGYWKVRVIQKHKLPSTVRQLIPPAFVLTVGGSAAVGILFPPLWLVTGSVGGAYLAASTAASVVTAARTEWKFLPVLPVIFGAYHVGYGLGFLRGVRDFVLKGRRGDEKLSGVTR